MRMNKLFSLAVMFVMIAAALTAAVPGVSAAYAEAAPADDGGDTSADASDDDESEDDAEDEESEDEGLDTEDLTDVKLGEETVKNGDGTVTLVRYADGTDEDGNAVHLEIRTTELPENQKLIVESEKVVFEDGTAEEEMSVTLITPEGEFQIEVENEIGENGEPVTELETEIDTEDDVPLTPERIQSMIARTNSLLKNIPGLNEDITNVINVLTGADGAVEITPEVFQKLVEDGMEIEISTKDGSISFDSDVCGSMSGMKDQIKVTMTQNDRTGLTPEQLETIGDKPFVTLGAESADGRIHELNGNANVTLSDMNLAGKKIVYVDENGGTEPMETQTVQGQLSFTTNHFSVFMAVDDSGGSSDPLPIIAVGAVIAIAIAGMAIYAFRRH